jgi:hypothetical protein
VCRRHGASIARASYAASTTASSIRFKKISNARVPRMFVTGPRAAATRGRARPCAPPRRPLTRADRGRSGSAPSCPSGTAG